MLCLHNSGSTCIWMRCLFIPETRLFYSFVDHLLFNVIPFYPFTNIMCVSKAVQASFIFSTGFEPWSNDTVHRSRLSRRGCINCTIDHWPKQHVFVQIIALRNLEKHSHWKSDPKPRLFYNTLQIWVILKQSWVDSVIFTSIQAKFSLLYWHSLWLSLDPCLWCI